MPKSDTDDKPKVTDWITGISTIVLVVITTIYVCFTHRMLSQGQSQLALAKDPVVTVEPEGQVEGKVGQFTLTLRNLGLSDLHNVRIYEDYFVSLTPSGEPITLTRFGGYS